MTRSVKKIIRYSDCFKLQIVEEIENKGLGLNECRLKYGISGSATIQRWLKQYGKLQLLNKVVRVETKEEKDELKRLREELKSLKQAYAELSLSHKCSETVIEVADEMLGTDLKKKYEQELLKYCLKKRQ